MYHRIAERIVFEGLGAWGLRSFDFVGFTVNLFVSIQFIKELNSELPIISKPTMFLAVSNKQVSSANSLGIVCNAFLISSA